MTFRDRLRDSAEEHGSRVVLALDLTGEPRTRASRAASMLKEIGDEAAAVKLNFQVILPTGLTGVARIAEVCSKKKLPLIADIKLNDIGSTNLETVRLLFGGGFDAVIANPFVGYEEGLENVIAEAHGRGKGIIFLVYMSHAGAVEGYALRTGGEPMFVVFAKRARDWDADGAIVSSKSAPIIKKVRSILKPDQSIISPGVGAQGGDAAEAVRAGSDLVIVGRSIVESPEPLAALRSLNEAIAET